MGCTTMFDLVDDAALGIFVNLGLDPKMGLQGLAALDRGANQPDSLVSQFLDQLPFYRNGQLEDAEHVLQTRLAMGLARAEVRVRGPIEPLFRDTWFDSDTGIIHDGPDPRPFANPGRWRFAAYE